MIIKLIAFAGCNCPGTALQGNVIAAITGCTWCSMCLVVYLIIIPLLDLFIGHRQGMYIAATVLLAIVIITDMEVQND